MDVKWLSSRSFIVGGTTYTVQVPITLDEALQEIQTTLSEIKEKKKYYEGLLKKLNFSDSFLNKAPIKVIETKLKLRKIHIKCYSFLMKKNINIPCI